MYSFGVVKAGEYPVTGPYKITT